MLVAARRRVRAWIAVNSLHVAVAACVVAGLVLIWVGGTSTALWASIVAAVGSSCLVAGVLALAVDGPLKRRFSAEIASETAANLFKRFLVGDRAPDQYIDEIRHIATAERLSTQTSWFLRFEATDSAHVRMRGQTHAVAKNISGGDLDLGRIWIQHSVDPTAEAHFVRYSAKIIKDGDASGTALKTIDADNEQLAGYRADTGTGWEVPISVIDKDCKVPALALQVVDWIGETTLPSNGYLLLSSSNPSLCQVIEISGPALETHEFIVRGREVSLVEDSSTSERRTYRIDRLSLSGNIVIVTWTPKRLDLADVERGRSESGSVGTEAEAAQSESRLDVVGDAAP